MAPKRDWVFLPPGYRPLVLALSTAVVALVVWNKVHPTSEPAAPEAPVSQLDLSGRLSDTAVHLPKPSGETVARRQQAAPGKPIEVVEEKRRTNQARSEEERSAINERLYQGLEQEKKRMGIVRIIEKDSKGLRKTDTSADSVVLPTR